MKDLLVLLPRFQTHRDDDALPDVRAAPALAGAAELDPDAELLVAHGLRR